MDRGAGAWRRRCLQTERGGKKKKKWGVKEQAEKMTDDRSTMLSGHVSHRSAVLFKRRHPSALLLHAGALTAFFFFV